MDAAWGFDGAYDAGNKEKIVMMHGAAMVCGIVQGPGRIKGGQAGIFGGRGGVHHGIWQALYCAVT